MALGHWIGGTLGFLLGGGFLGTIAGAVLGGFIQKKLHNSNFDEWNTDEHSPFADDNRRRYEQSNPEGQQNDFRFALLVLASYVIQADGRIMHSEMEHVRRFLRVNFGETAVVEGNEILQRLFEHRQNTIDQNGRAAYEQLIAQSCKQMRMLMNEGMLLQILSFLCDIAKADGKVEESELIAIKQLAQALGIHPSEVDSLLSLGGESLDDAYRVLEISPSATDDEVRQAYKKLALRHHPDRVATLGEDVQRAAEQKFQEIGAAKERIFKARGMR